VPSARILRQTSQRNPRGKQPQSADAAIEIQGLEHSKDVVAGEEQLVEAMRAEIVSA
jgi:hypothetical protein